MPDSPRPFPVPPEQPSPDRLDSWKDIASYLGREVRTVQGWEKTEGLPIHRHQHARQGSVYAFKSELDVWRKRRASVPETPSPVLAEPEKTVPVVAEPEVLPARKSSKLPWIGAAAAVVLLIAVGIVFWLRQRNSSSAPASVAVLPFADYSPNKDQEYFSDGLTEEIIDALSRVPNLHVVARTSAFQFKGKAADIREIGRKLNVDSVLEGSVRKSGDEVRITAQLNRVSDGYHLWSRTYDRQMRDIFALQHEISQAIADQLGGGRVSRREPTSDMEAYRLYQEGRHFFNQFDTLTAYPKAIERFQMAVARDPNFALAYSGMADAYAYEAENFSSPPKEVMPKAKAAAEKAVALDPMLGEAHTSLGIVKLDYEWDFQAAEREFRRAMELNPGSGYGVHWLGHALEAQCRVEEAIEQFRKALALDPLSIPIYWDLAGDLVQTKRYDEGIALTKKSRELFPENAILTADEIGIYVQMHDIRTARKLRDAWKPPPELLNSPQLIAADGMLAALEGNLTAGRKALDQVEEMRKTQHVEEAAVLGLCHALSDRACVMTWLQRAYDNRSSSLPYVRVYTPEFIAGIPEAQALIERALGPAGKK